LGAGTVDTLAEATDAFGPTAVNYWQPGVVFDHDQELAGAKPMNYETAATMSGGTDNTRYFASAVVRHEGGIIKSTYADKQSLRLNIDQNIGDRITLNVSTEAIHTANDRGLTGNGNAGVSYYDALTTSPNFINLQQNADGSWPVNPYANSNPLATIAEESNPETVWRIISSG